MATRLILAALLAMVLAFALSLTEASVSRISPRRAHQLRERGRRGSAALVVVAVQSAPYLAVVTFLRIVAESAAAVLFTLAVVGLVPQVWAAFLVSLATLAVVSFVLVAVSPRTLGRQHADAVALSSAPVLLALRPVLGPVARMLVVLGNMLTPGRGYRHGPFESEAELRDLVDLAGESSLIEAGEQAMIHSVFELGDTLVREVMVPRTDMVTIDADRSLRSGMSLFLRSGFSRMPVAGEDSDDLLGVLYFKDVARRVTADPGSASLSVTEAMRPARFVPESKQIDALLREMQRDQSHFAVVIDEYGGTAGLVTIEDILEEIVGEIADEYDREAPGVEQLADGGTRVPATMAVDDLAELFGVSIEEEEVDTVGGLLGKTLGRVPILGAYTEVAGLSLTAERMAGRRHRIATVVVRRVDTDTEQSEPESHPSAEAEPPSVLTTRDPRGAGSGAPTESDGPNGSRGSDGSDGSARRSERVPASKESQ